MNEHDDKFEKAGPYIAVAIFVAWLAWCTPDAINWFGRF